MSRPARIFISAGEASGDRLGAGLARALLDRRPDLELVGMGGPLMRAQGVRLIQCGEDDHVVSAIRTAEREEEGTSAPVATAPDEVEPADGENEEPVAEEDADEGGES